MARVVEVVVIFRQYLGTYMSGERTSFLFKRLPKTLIINGAFYLIFGSLKVTFQNRIKSH
jgi:hypothetical protein